MTFKEMARDTLADILAGAEDVLTKLVEADQAIYDDAYCPRCGGSCSPELDVAHALRSDRPIPRKNCRCLDCGCLFEPFTRLVLEMGNLARLEPQLPIFDPEGD